MIRKSRKGGNYRFNSGVLRPTIFPDSGRLYLFEAVLTHASPVVPGTRRGSMLSLQGNTSNDSNTIWKHMGFWEDLFFGKLGIDSRPVFNNKSSYVKLGILIVPKLF